MNTNKPITIIVIGVTQLSKEIQGEGCVSAMIPGERKKVEVWSDEPGQM